MWEPLKLTTTGSRSTSSFEDFDLDCSPSFMSLNDCTRSFESGSGTCELIDSVEKPMWREVRFQDVIDFKEGPGVMAEAFRPTGVPLLRLAGLDGPGSVLRGCSFLDPSRVARQWAHFAVA